MPMRHGESWRSNRKSLFHFQRIIPNENFSKRLHWVARFITASIHKFRSLLNLFGEVEGRSDPTRSVETTDPT